MRIVTSRINSFFLSLKQCIVSLCFFYFLFLKKLLLIVTTHRVIQK